MLPGVSLVAVGAMDGTGEALRLLRGGRSQADVAKSAGLAPSVINRAERGHGLPSMATLDAILTALGKDAHDLADALDRVQGREPKLSPETVDEVRERAGDPDLEAELLRELAAQNARILDRLERRRKGS